MSVRYRPCGDKHALGRSAVFGGLALALAVGACAPGDGVTGRRAFVETLGDDTTAVEVYTRLEDGFEGDLVVRSPVTQLAHYAASLGPDGAVQRWEVHWRTPAENPDGPAPASFVVTIEGDSATIEVTEGQQPGVRTVAVPAGVVPTPGGFRPSYSGYEQAVLQAGPGLESIGDSVAVSFLFPLSGRLGENAVVLEGPDSVSLDFFGSPLAVNLGEAGGLLRLSGERTTLKTVAVRAAGDVDVAMLAADFAGRDARGEGMGVASPTDTVETMVAGARLSVIYSRPAKRGREIWGGLVPYGEVWRTGANAATHFSTEADLEIGGVDVPAGDYTLYSIYASEGGQLIINQQTGQWGTVYNEDQDLARVAMEQDTLEEPVERFTIAFEEAHAGTVLSLMWDRTRFSVPVVTR